jgi:hypothetical protein
MPDQFTRKRAPRQPRVQCLCVTCGQPFMCNPSRIATGGGRFCSRACVVPRDRALRSDVDRFWEKVAKNGSDDCWLWIATTTHGYGAFHKTGGNGLNVGAHRFAFALSYGVIPEGMHILHTCDNRACCRNDDEGWYFANGTWHPRRGHLWLGTNEDNVADMMAKGRYRQGTLPHGTDHPNAKLTDADVAAIRASFTGAHGQVAQLTRQYGVSRTLIGLIVEGKVWKHVTASSSGNALQSNG